MSGPGCRRDLTPISCAVGSPHPTAEAHSRAVGHPTPGHPRKRGGQTTKGLTPILVCRIMIPPCQEGRIGILACRVGRAKPGGIVNWRQAVRLLRVSAGLKT